MRRTIALKSNRSQDPTVVTNIRLSKCEDLGEVFKTIEANPMQMTNQFFALRVIARLIQTNRSQIRSLESETYYKLLKGVNASVQDSKSLDIADFLYFIRMTQDYGYQNILGDPNIFEKKISETFESSSFTIKSLSNILHNGQLSGFLCTDIFKYIYSNLLNTENDFLTLMEMKNLSRSLKIQRVENNEKFALDYIKKLDQLTEKNNFEVNSILFILKNLAAVEKMRHKKLPLDHYFQHCQSQIDYFSENDYSLVLKIERDTPGLFDPNITKTLLERIQKSIEKKSSRLSINFLIDCIPLIQKDPANSKLINMIVDYTIEKLQNREVRLILFSKLCLNLIKSPREQINCVFNVKLMKTLAQGNFLDALLFRSRFDSKSVFDEYRISPENINEFLLGRNFKTLIFHYLNFKDFENSDIQLMNDKIRLKIKDFVDKRSLNARCLFSSIRDMEISNEFEPDSMREFNSWIQNTLVSEFNHCNLVYLLLIKENEPITFNYIEKHKGLINTNDLATALVENCFLITDTKLKFLLSVFPDSCSLGLAYVIQSLRKDPNNKEVLQILAKFTKGLLSSCEVFKTYPEEAGQILNLLN